jgi:hypothetical protein
LLWVTVVAGVELSGWLVGELPLVGLCRVRLLMPGVWIDQVGHRGVVGICVVCGWVALTVQDLVCDGCRWVAVEGGSVGVLAGLLVGGGVVYTITIGVQVV